MSNLVVYLASDESSFSTGAKFYRRGRNNQDFCILLCSRSLHTCMSSIKRVPGKESSFALAVRFLKNGVADIGSVKFFVPIPAGIKEIQPLQSDSVGQCGKNH
jgi:hypothetical protein